MDDNQRCEACTEDYVCPSRETDCGDGESNCTSWIGVDERQKNKEQPDAFLLAGHVCRASRCVIFLTLVFGRKQRWEIRWHSVLSEVDLCCSYRFVVHGGTYLVVERGVKSPPVCCTPCSVEALTQRQVLLGWNESSCVQHVVHPPGSAGQEPYSNQTRALSLDAILCLPLGCFTLALRSIAVDSCTNCTLPSVCSARDRRRARNASAIACFKPLSTGKTAPQRRWQHGKLADPFRLNVEGSVVRR